MSGTKKEPKNLWGWVHFPCAGHICPYGICYVSDSAHLFHCCSSGREECSRKQNGRPITLLFSFLLHFPLPFCILGISRAQDVTGYRGALVTHFTWKALCKMGQQCYFLSIPGFGVGQSYKCTVTLSNQCQAC